MCLRMKPTDLHNPLEPGSPLMFILLYILISRQLFTRLWWNSVHRFMIPWGWQLLTYPDFFLRTTMRLRSVMFAISTHRAQTEMKSVHQTFMIPSGWIRLSDSSDLFPPVPVLFIFNCFIKYSIGCSEICLSVNCNILASESVKLLKW